MADEAKQQAIREANGPMREKYWEECTVEEKLDRLRDQIKSMYEAQMGGVQRIALLQDHCHDTQGRVCVHLNDKEGGPGGMGYAPRSAYRILTTRERER